MLAIREHGLVRRLSRALIAMLVLGHPVLLRLLQAHVFRAALELGPQRQGLLSWPHAYRAHLAHGQVAKQHHQ